MYDFVEVIKQRKRMCDSFEDCENCALYAKDCGVIPERNISDAIEYEKAVMDWAKEHPAITKADKFKEVFGVDIQTDTPWECNGIKCPPQTKCDDCKYKNFWLQEYKETKKDGN